MTDKQSAFVLSAFGDEIHDDVDSQLQSLNELGIHQLELRKAWGINVLHLNNEQIQRLRLACQQYSIHVNCIGSRVGKSPITDALDSSISDLITMLELAAILDTDRVRIFSFYPPENSRDDKYVIESALRLKHLAEIAETRGITLLMENENGMVGDTPERCAELLKLVDNDHLQFVWDTGNFPHTGVDRPVEKGWHILRKYIKCVQVKDARVSDRIITVAGEGDGQIFQLLQHLRDANYRGVLALEPHLKHAGQYGGFSGPDAMRQAVAALRKLMQQAECTEVNTL